MLFPKKERALGVNEPQPDKCKMHAPLYEVRAAKGQAV